MAKEKSALQVFLSGIVEENPILVLMIGLCPLLAVSSNANDALGMGVAASFVLVASNVFISLLRKVIPASVRIPIFPIGLGIGKLDFAGRSTLNDLERVITDRLIPYTPRKTLPISAETPSIIGRKLVKSCAQRSLLSPFDGRQFRHPHI